MTCSGVEKKSTLAPGLGGGMDSLLKALKAAAAAEAGGQPAPLLEQSHAASADPATKHGFKSLVNKVQCSVQLVSAFGRQRRLLLKKVNNRERQSFGLTWEFRHILSKDPETREAAELEMLEQQAAALPYFAALPSLGDKAKANAPPDLKAARSRLHRSESRKSRKGSLVKRTSNKWKRVAGTVKKEPSDKWLKTISAMKSEEKEAEDESRDLILLEGQVLCEDSTTHSMPFTLEARTLEPCEVIVVPAAHALRAFSYAAVPPNISKVDDVVLEPAILSLDAPLTLTLRQLLRIPPTQRAPADVERLMGILHALVLCQHMTAAALKSVAEHSLYIRLTDDEVLFEHGDYADFVYILLAGSVLIEGTPVLAASKAPAEEVASPKGVRMRMQSIMGDLGSTFSVKMLQDVNAPETDARSSTSGELPPGKHARSARASTLARKAFGSIFGGQERGADGGLARCASSAAGFPVLAGANGALFAAEALNKTDMGTERDSTVIGQGECELLAIDRWRLADALHRGRPMGKLSSEASVLLRLVLMKRGDTRNASEQSWLIEMLDSLPHLDEFDRPLQASLAEAAQSAEYRVADQEGIHPFHTTWRMVPALGDISVSRGLLLQPGSPKQPSGSQSQSKSSDIHAELYIVLSGMICEGTGQHELAHPAGGVFNDRHLLQKKQISISDARCARWTEVLAVGEAVYRQQVEPVHAIMMEQRLLRLSALGVCDQIHMQIHHYSDAHFWRLLSDCCEQRYSNGSLLLEQGTISGHLYMIEEGTASLVHSRTTETGVDTLVVTTICKGDYFGDVSVFLKAVEPLSVVANVAVELVAVPGPALLQAMTRENITKFAGQAATRRSRYLQMQTTSTNVMSTMRRPGNVLLNKTLRPGILAGTQGRISSSMDGSHLTTIRRGSQPLGLFAAVGDMLHTLEHGGNKGARPAHQKPADVPSPQAEDAELDANDDRAVADVFDGAPPLEEATSPAGSGSLLETAASGRQHTGSPESCASDSGMQSEYYDADHTEAGIDAPGGRVHRLVDESRPASDRNGHRQWDDAGQQQPTAASRQVEAAIQRAYAALQQTGLSRGARHWEPDCSWDFLELDSDNEQADGSGSESSVDSLNATREPAGSRPSTASSCCALIQVHNIDPDAAIAAATAAFIKTRTLRGDRRPASAPPRKPFVPAQPVEAKSRLVSHKVHDPAHRAQRLASAAAGRPLGLLPVRHHSIVMPTIRHIMPQTTDPQQA
ncbi:hypothetical protein WJX72_009785 [[Myrmecia] bisecta]|uniref:Cyclic nucleotide-binding domain-containing protein n=1 Tax=[Myrmecia] bisecta TaxID=41462 RepID=A0AAW1PXL8_9CHLO